MSKQVAILGVGMHPWGKWGRNFVEYGVKAARDALADASVPWQDIDFVAGADTMRCGYPGYVAGATFAQALGWSGARIASCYAACASGSQALDTARAQILAGLADVALVVGADTTPKGFLAPQKGDRPDDPDWLRFRLHGATNPVYFALHARRRVEVYGTTDEDIAAVRVKNGKNGLHNPNARYRKEFTLEEVLESPMVSDPLRLYEICATSDGGAAVVIASMEYAKRLQKQPVTVEAISTITPTFPSTQLELPDLATDSAASVPAPEMNFKPAIIAAAYEEAGIGPEDLSLAEVYDLSTSMELDCSEPLKRSA
jgi:acetyl-CoA acetyltransferase